MPVTRIKNNQITDLTVNAAAKLQDFSVTSAKIANNLTYDSNLIVTGNLTVQGNVTAIDTQDLVVEDPLILLAKDQIGVPSLDIGFIGKRGDELNIAFVWDESADRFVTAFTSSEVSNTVITINSYASLQVLDFDAANVTITGNTSIGNIAVNANSVIDMGNVVIGNVAEPVANNDAATKAYVDAQSSSGFTIEDDAANTTQVSGGDTLILQGTANEITVLITNTDEVTFGLPANVTIANDLTVTANASAVTFLGNIDGATGTFTGNVSGDTFLGNIDGATGEFTGNVSGDTFLGNIDGTTGTFTSNVSAANVDASTAVNTNLIAGTSVQIDSTGDIVLNPTGNINVSGVRVRNMSDPQLAFDAATKQYVDDAVSAGIHVHPPVDVETTAPLTTVTYANGGNVFTVNETIAGNTVVFTTAANLQVNDQLWFDNSFNGVVGNLAYFVVSTPNTSAAVLTTAYNGVPVSNITSGSGLTESVRVNSGIGATLTATANGAIVVDGVSLSAGNRVMVNDQLNQIENGVYEVTDAGNVTAPYILTRSSDADTYEPQTSDGLDQGSYFYVESGDVGAGASYVKTAPSGPFIFGVANIVFTQFSASQVYSANTQAGLSLSGTVFSAKVDNDTTAFDGGGNISVKAGANLTTPNIGNATGNSLTLSGNGLVSAVTVSATGNVSGGNVTTAGIVSATGNVSGGNIITAGSVSGNTGTFTGNVTADTFLGNIDGATGTFTGNVSGDTFLGNIDGATGDFTGNVTANLFIGAFAGNISGNIAAAGSNTQVQFNDDNLLGASANFTFDQATGQVTISGSLTADNVVVDGDSITSLGTELVINDAGGDINFRVEGDSEPNLLIVDAGSDTVLIGTATPTQGAALKIGTTDSFLPPVGNLVQRPATPVTGMLRFSTAEDALEVYTAGDGWQTVGVPSFTVITADEFTGNGVQTQFTLSEDSTTAGTIVSINGVVQIPTTAYAVSGNVLTFTEAPESTDAIDARILTTTTSVLGLSNGSGNAAITLLETAPTIEITGNVVPTISNVYNLGSSTLRWKEIFLEGSTITLGNVVMKNTTGNTIGFFGPDGETGAEVQAGEIDVSSMTDGTSIVGIDGVNGNVFVTVGGVANVLLATQTRVEVSALQTTGNITAGNLEITGSASFPSLNVSDEVLITGNLIVNGTTITANVANVVIVDPIIGLGSGANGDPLTSNDGLDRGLQMFYYTTAQQQAFVGFDNDAGKIISAANVTVANNVVTVNSFGNTVVGTLESALVTATGNITGGNIITAGLVSLSSITKTGSNGVGNIGQSNNSFDTIFAKATSAQYADLAEMYEADAAIEPGTVVAFGGVREVTISYVCDDVRVAGVVSTNPSYIMNSALAGEHPVAVALTGRVPTRVTGAVRKGDMMVSAGDGTARACAAPQIGTVIGKALEDHDGASGVIEVVVGRL